jgi:tetratricopeptide (TPR) repeat protein
MVYGATVALLTGCTSIPNPLALFNQASPSPTPASVSSPPPVAAAPPKAAGAGQSQAVKLNNQGVGKIAKADYKGALKDFAQALKVDPKLTEAHLGRGIAYSGLGNTQAAIKAYNQAIKLKPSFAQAYLNRADEYATLGQKQRAIADLQKASQLFTKQGDAANYLATKIRLEDLQTPPAVPAVDTLAATPAAPRVQAPPVTQPFPIALAQHLTQMGAKMYGAYWCSVCDWQREQFGDVAARQITEIECDARGQNPQPNLCQQAGVEAYPSWEINGQLYRGGLSLEDLADISGYQGPRNF